MEALTQQGQVVKPLRLGQFLRFGETFVMVIAAAGKGSLNGIDLHQGKGKIAPSIRPFRIPQLVNLGEIQGNEMHWAAEASMSFARGNHASVEATAWAAMALIQDGRFNTEAGKALNWLIQQKDPQGTWGTTHGTVLALKAMVLSLKQATREVNATVLARVNGRDAARVTVTPENADLFRQIDLSPYVTGNEQTIEIDLEGEGSLLYQVVGKYFAP